MKLLNLLTLFVLGVFVFACNGDEDADDVGKVTCTEFGADEEVQAAMDNFMQAAAAYGQDPNSTNCNAYLNALDNYFEVIDVYVNECYDDEAFDQWRAGVDEWKAERDQLDCES